MSLYSIKVNFVCKSCRDSFNDVDEFIEHKKSQHFDEFQNITSIDFDERDEYVPVSVITGDNKRPHPIEGTSQSKSSKNRRKRIKLAKRKGAPTPTGIDGEVVKDVSNTTGSAKKRNAFEISSDEEEAGAGTETGKTGQTAKRRPKGILYKCNVDNCRSEFLTPSGLEGHSEKKHGQRKIQFNCYVCKEAFDANDDLLNHFKEHEDERRFKCIHEGCTAAFKVKKRLNRHIKTHEQKLLSDLSNENLEQNLIEIEGN